LLHQPRANAAGAKALREKKVGGRQRKN
jgi:hypothetical protein